MSEKDAKISFIFPNNPNLGSKKSAIADIVGSIQMDEEIGYAGFENIGSLKHYLSTRFTGNSSWWEKPNESEIENIRNEIEAALTHCFKHLPSKGMNIFVLPWLNTEYDDDFKGVNGFSPYPNVVHLFMGSRFSLESIRETVAHEFNHATFLKYRNSPKKLTLLETFVFEGLAEHFREKVLGGRKAPWVKVLNTVECKSVLETLESKFESDDQKIYEEVFFGGEKYKKWTGYSIGYLIVGEFLKAHPKMSWQEIMKTDTRLIFTSSWMRL